MLVRLLSLLALLATTTVTTAWVSSPFALSAVPPMTTRSSRVSIVALFSTPEPSEEQPPEQPPVSSQEEEDDVPPSSFDDAGAQILESETQERIDMMGQDIEDIEFEEKKLEYEAMREAIRQRTKDLGIEKSKLTAQLIEEANARAAAGQSVQGSLDLSQISGMGMGTPKSLYGGDSSSEGDFELPSFMYDPDQELTDEQKKEIDPVGALPLIDQAKDELSYTEFPESWDVVKEVVVALLMTAVSGWIIINWDNFVLEHFRDFGLLPKLGEVRTQFEGLELPEGWTDNMSEKDIANLPSDIAKDAAAATIDAATKGN